MGIVGERYKYLPGPPLVIRGHSHDEYQVCLSLDQSREYTYRGTRHPVSAGDISVVIPGEVHAFRDAEPRRTRTTYRVLYVRPTVLSALAEDIIGRAVSLPLFPDLVLWDLPLSRALLAAHLAGERSASRLEQEDRLVAVLGELVARYALKSPAALAPRQPIQVQIARDYLHEHYEEDLSLTHLARVADLHPHRLHRLFRQTYGLPPHAYLTQVRVERAKALLRRGVRIGEVAAMTGFADQSHFTRHFKRLVSVTPGRYRPAVKKLQDN